MAHKIIGSIIGTYHPKLSTGFVAADTCTAGYPYYLSGGQWTLSTSTLNIDAICIDGSSAGDYPVMELVKAGDIVEASYSGTASTSALYAGITTAALTTAGGNVSSTALATGGHLKILSIDTVNSKCQYLATKNYTNATT